MRRIALMVLLVTFAACTKSTSYDLVVANGRVIDPESGLDGVRHVGITAGKITRQNVCQRVAPRLPAASSDSRRASYRRHR